MQQLVTSVFRDLWFAPTPEGGDQKEKLIRRVTNITAVVSWEGGIMFMYACTYLLALYPECLQTRYMYIVQVYINIHTSWVMMCQSYA